jgi:hypothetical protein
VKTKAKAMGKRQKRRKDERKKKEETYKGKSSDLMNTAVPNMKILCSSKVACPKEGLTLHVQSQVQEVPTNTNLP